MTFKEAQEELKELSAGAAYSISYLFAEYIPGIVSTQIIIWMSGAGSASGATFRAALDNLKNTLAGKKPVEPFPEVQC